MSSAHAGEFLGNRWLSPSSDNQEVDRIVVKYKKQSLGQAVGSLERRARENVLASQFGFDLRHKRYMHNGAEIVELSKKTSYKDVSMLLDILKRNDKQIELAEVDVKAYPTMVPNDQLYAGYQWYFSNSTVGVNAEPAWNTYTGSYIKVAVLDTGYRPHVDLTKSMLPGYDFVSDSARANDGSGRDSDALDPGDWVAANECGPYTSAANSTWHGTGVMGDNWCHFK